MTKYQHYIDVQGEVYQLLATQRQLDISCFENSVDPDKNLADKDPQYFPLCLQNMPISRIFHVN